MSQQKYSVGYKLEDEKGKVIFKGDITFPGVIEFPGLEPNTEYVLTCNPPEQLHLSPNPLSCRTGEKHTDLTVTLGWDENASKYTVQDASGDRVKQVPKLLARAAVGVLGVGSVATVAFSPTVLPPVGNVLKPPVISSSKPGVPTIEPRSLSSLGTTATRTTASNSELGAKLRECVKANFENVSGISELSDLAKQDVLARLTDEELAKEMMQWYGNIDRFRQIIQEGCDPELARQLMTLTNRESNSTPTRSTPSNLDRFRPNLRPSSIAACNGWYGDANFRSAPTKADRAILGSIASGRQVYLTGSTHEAEGVVWYEAIAPTAVPDAGKQIMPNQVGWIAGCFMQ